MLANQHNIAPHAQDSNSRRAWQTVGLTRSSCKAGMLLIKGYHWQKPITSNNQAMSAIKKYNHKSAHISKC